MGKKSGFPKEFFGGLFFGGSMDYELPKTVLTFLGGFSSLPVMDPSLTIFISKFSLKIKS